MSSRLFAPGTPARTVPDAHPFAQAAWPQPARTPAQVLYPRYVPVSVRRGPACGASGRLHGHGYSGPLPSGARLPCAAPMGWDAFGLPAEQYAIRTGQHPRKTTEANIATFKRQIQSLGFSYDWSREIDTTDPRYFKWTQWIFLKLYSSWFNPQTNKAEPIETLDYPPDWPRARTARRIRPGSATPRLPRFRAPGVCHRSPGLVVRATGHRAGQRGSRGRQERSRRFSGGAQADAPVDAPHHRLCRAPVAGSGNHRLEQLAQRNAAQLDWPQKGAEVDFEIADAQLSADERRLRVFTTRPDTLFGATYMVLAPEHRLVERITTPAQRAGGRGIPAPRWPRNPTSNAPNWPRKKPACSPAPMRSIPVNGEKIPIWIADYVLISYGTGAIMAVPGHDTRDFEFATKFQPAHRAGGPAAGGQGMAAVMWTMASRSIPPAPEILDERPAHPGSQAARSPPGWRPNSSAKDHQL